MERLRHRPRALWPWMLLVLGLATTQNLAPRATSLYSTSSSLLSRSPSPHARSYSPTPPRFTAGLKAWISRRVFPRPVSPPLRRFSTEIPPSVRYFSGGKRGVSAGVVEGGEEMERVSSVDVADELSSSFMRYSMMTILSRALPDMRDGLKPVHRRILYAMHKLGLQPDTQFRKCARVVGEVLGKYHPHGDVAVYDAMVRMAQDFVMSVPLVLGHGNFGSLDNDPPAAMRYTEAKLSKFSRDGLLADIGKDTVDFLSNFDDSELEPVILPAKVPLLLINGASGIAVGMATNIPPHNLQEIVDATIALIKQPNLSDPDLLGLVPGPDFPTGGVIMGGDGASKLYKTGHGSIIVRAVVEEETYTKKGGGGTRQKKALIVTQLPYLSNKAALVERIAQLCDDKKLEGVSGIRDESDSEGMRVVIQLKQDAIPSVVLSNLYQKTQLQSTFSGNFVAVGSGGLEPVRFTLRSAIMDFIKFREETIRRRARFDLNKLQQRAHIVSGMLIVRSKLETAVNCITSSDTTQQARQRLMEPKTFNLTEKQADAILSMRLSQLTKLENQNLQKEFSDLQVRIEELNHVLDSQDKVSAILISELQEIRHHHGVPRRTQVDESSHMIEEESYHPNEQVAVITTRRGYIKRIKVSDFQMQNRGTSGKAGARMGDGDAVNNFFTCSTHDTLLFISANGITYSKRAFEIPQASRIARGTPLQQVLPISAGDQVSGIVPISSLDISDESDQQKEISESKYLILLTKQGWVKKTPLEAFSRISARGLVAINIEEGDELLKVQTCTDKDTVILGTKNGLSIRFNSSDLRPTGRASRGVTAIALKDGDSLVDMDIVPYETDQTQKNHLLVVTKGGYGKRVEIDEFKVQKRGGVGIIATKFKTQANTLPELREIPPDSALPTDNDINNIDNINNINNISGLGGDTLASMRALRGGNEVMLITEQGTLVRIKADQISLQRRAATGVVVQKFDDGNSLQSAAVVPPEIAAEDFL